MRCVSQRLRLGLPTNARRLVVAFLVCSVPSGLAAQQQSLPEKWTQEDLAVMTRCRGEPDQASEVRPDKVEDLVKMMYADLVLDRASVGADSLVEAGTAGLSCFWQGVLDLPNQYEYFDEQTEDTVRTSVTMAARGRAMDTAWFWTFFARSSSPEWQPGVGAASTQFLLSFGCRRGTLSVLQQTTWLTDGTSQSSPSDGSQTFVAPGTLGEKMLDYACSDRS